MEFLRAAHRRGLAAGRLERAQVLGHVALKGEHTDDRLHRSSLSAQRSEAGAA